jgi:hypothetical protein
LAKPTSHASEDADGLREVAGPEGWTYFECATPRFAFAVHPDDQASFRRGWGRLRSDLEAHRPELLVLVPFRRTPTLDHPARRRIHSFGAAELDATRIAALHGDAPRDDWAYLSCRAALQRGPAGRASRLLVRELPPGRWHERLRAALQRPGFSRLPDPRPLARPDPAVMAIPHAGDLEPLEALLGLLDERRAAAVRVAVGFDEPLTEAHRSLVDRFERFEFWSVAPCGGGPYVFRAFVASRAPEPWVIFQDSDDVPCVDRLPALLAGAGTADILGSWELQVDERRARLQCVRFPVDADRAIRATGHAAQLHPTTIARTRALARAGGLSTAHRFASDREIQLRMAFDYRLRNLDRVLYVRARREGTLSTAPDSAVRSEARASLRETWDRAFRAIREGRAAVADGGLGPSHRDAEIAFTELRSGRTERVRFGDRPGDSLPPGASDVPC